MVKAQSGISASLEDKGFLKRNEDKTSVWNTVADTESLATIAKCRISVLVSDREKKSGVSQ